MCLCAVCGGIANSMLERFFIHLQFFNVRPVAFVRNFGFIYFFIIIIFYTFDRLLC